RGQSEAIARNLQLMAGLKTPVIATVIGEGGSGGALGIGVADRLYMLEYGTYSVISPEGCASILWKSAEKASDAAEAMAITSKRLRELGFIDRVIEEPLGGAHRHVQATAQRVKDALVEELQQLQTLTLDELLAKRYERYMNLGEFKEAPART
ncbi:MAG TPA: acetyl-CoA carboxylase carboxyl transferase subunit alpha, partial [Gammaproteobacteria bacterium]|nr:acetyl-CoA carboxylase carboxyl transferase subunit alpha [Gammaproteobacteria bacterium]